MKPKKSKPVIFFSFFLFLDFFSFQKIYYLNLIKKKLVIYVSYFKFFIYKYKENTWTLCQFQIYLKIRYLQLHLYIYHMQLLGFDSCSQVNPIEPNKTHLMWNFLDTWENVWKLEMVFEEGLKTKKN